MTGRDAAPPAQVSSAFAPDILAWTEGWARSRRVRPPSPIADGVHLRVGTSTESGRFVLTVADSERARALAAQVQEVDFWIKWPAAPHDDEPSMPEGWTNVERQFLMGTRLERTLPALPSGYHLEVHDEGDAVEARILTDAGELAARGRMGLTAIAVPDQIVTHDAHMRRGLGRVVMSSLSHASLDRGYSEAVLLASAQGRHLYSSLGWRLLTPFWASLHRERCREIAES